MSTDITTHTTCPYCGVGCGVLATPDGKGIAIAGDPNHPANFGRLCSKGSALGETLSPDGRLLYPEIGGVRVEWSAALDAVARGFAETIETYGPDSVALYVSGQLLTEDYYAANKFTKGFLGTANIDSNSRLCMASAVTGHKRAFGEDVVPGTYEDLELADLIVLVGSNTAWCHPVLYQRILAARNQRLKAGRPGMRIVVLDPRRTATGEGADLHLPLAAGTDVALFTGLLVHLADAGATDLAYVADATNGATAALAAAREQTPDAATTAALCGLDPVAVETFFAWFAATPRVVTMFSQGVNQSSSGADKVNAILNVHLLTGRIGSPGAGPFSVTGQPNAMGGREVGALANTLAAHLEWDRPGDVDRLHQFWDAPNLARRPGRTAVDLFRAIGRGDIRAIWIIATNPAVSLPEADDVRRALGGCDLVVVSDCVRDSDTVDLAHIRLPAQGWGEKDGTVTNSERVISRQRRFLPVAGDAKPDWWIISEVARRMGFSSAFAWQSPADIFREHAALSGLSNFGTRIFDISALADLTDAGYERMPPTRWPCPTADSRRQLFTPTSKRLFGNGGFPAPNGRARILPTRYRPPAQSTDADFPLVLLTGRIRDQWHTMTRTGKTARLLAHQPEPLLSVHPDDAASLNDGSLVTITAATGNAVLRVRHDPGLRRGEVFAPMHWTDRFCPAGRINPVVNAAVDPVSFQPELKHTPVRLDPFPAQWHGFLLARHNCGTSLADYVAVLPANENIWRHELAGIGPAEPAFERLREFFGATPWMKLDDPATGLFRAALIEDGVLQACLFLAPDASSLPLREWLVSCFARDALTPRERRTLLAGRPADGPLPEPPICVCHGIGASAITAAIVAGCHSIEAVGAATKAGSNCGSCKPEIRTLLQTIKRPEPA
jgi:assimilatory nitrate reductase catalytic subunit